MSAATSVMPMLTLGCNVDFPEAWLWQHQESDEYCPYTVRRLALRVLYTNGILYLDFYVCVETSASLRAQVVKKL